MSTFTRIRLGSRGSRLALAQAEEVRLRLAAAHPTLENVIEIVVIRTTGDTVRDRPLAEIGGKGLFTKEIEEALMDGRIDAAMHSLKDVPSVLPPGLTLTATLPRASPFDALFAREGGDLDALRAGAVVGTTSPRRQAQVLLRRPDCRVVPFRGNVETRLAKLAEGQVDATLLAVAGLERLGLGLGAATVLSPEAMLPAGGQGAIGLEVRADDETLRDLLAAIDDRDSALRVTAERACLGALGGSCYTPIAAFAELEDEGERLRLSALLAAPDGSQVFRTCVSGLASEAEALGVSAGRELRERAGEGFMAMLEQAL